MSDWAGGQEIIVRLLRDSLDSPWGFRLHGGSEHNAPLVVSKVFPLTAADGNLKPGDVLKKVGHTDVSRLRHKDAIDEINNAGSSVDLFVIRPKVLSNGKPWSDDNRETVIPRNKNLANIMQRSLSQGEDGEFSGVTRRPHAWQTDLQSNKEPKPDITTFLPNRYNRLRGSSTPCEIKLVSDVRNAMLQRSPSQGSSGRSSPSTSLIELKSAGEANPAVGVWIPPPHNPTAQLTHLQYNSPMPMYTADNIADMVEKTSGGKIEWINKRPTPNYFNDIRESPTYKLIQESEGKRAPAQNRPFEQSSCMKNLEKTFQMEGLLK